VAFLLTIHPQVPIGYQYKYSEEFVKQVGLVYVRGCEIEGLLDDQGKVIEEGESLGRGAHNHSPNASRIQDWRVKIQTHSTVWQVFFSFSTYLSIFWPVVF
jgi:hypothetical protein